MSGFSHTLECNGAVFIQGKDENDLTLVSISEDGTVVNWNCFTGQVNYKLRNLMMTLKELRVRGSRSKYMVILLPLVAEMASYQL